MTTPGAQLIRLLTPCANACDNLTLAGRAQDGGYLTCDDVLVRREPVRAGFSFGVKGRDSWGIAIASRLRIPVFEFDCFHTRAPVAPPGVQLTFVPQCVGLRHEQRQHRTFNTVGAFVRKYAPAMHSAKQSRVAVKMDIEGGEFDAFLTMDDATLRSIRHLNFELHGVSGASGTVCRTVGGKRDCWKPTHGVHDTVRFLTALDRFFVLVGVHGNNWWGASSVQGRTVPELMELTYVNRDSLPASFAACEPVNLKELNRFMKPNHPGRREIDTLAPCTPNAQCSHASIT